MKAWILGPLSLGAAMFFVSACALVEDFQGYEPLGSGGTGSTCDKPPCPSSSTSSNSSGGGIGVGGAGGNGSSTGGGGSGGDEPIRCAKIPCNGSPCMPEVLVANSQFGLVAVDSESLFIRTDAPSHLIRIAKPGCVIPPFDQLIDYSVPDQGTVSDGRYVAWLKLDISGSCVAPPLTFCDPADCKPQEIPVPPLWADQGPFSRLALGPDHLYFTMRNGLVGRVAKGSTQVEQLWIDPGNQSGAMKRGYLRYPTVSDGQIAVVREFLETDGSTFCSGGPNADSGAIWLSDATPGATPQTIAQSLHFPAAIAMSKNYVYFHMTDNATLVHRVPRSGGAVEKFAKNAMISPTNGFGNILVHKDWVYFRVSLPDMKEGIARLPAETANSSVDTAEIVAESFGFRNIYIDDDALYWDECTDAMCASLTFRVLARVMAP